MRLTDAEILSAMYKNFDPVKPAEPEFYVDCSDVRGGGHFVQKLCLELTEVQEKDEKKQGYIHALFAGHIGGGKSSELRQLQLKMREKEPTTGNKRFFPVFVDMKEYLDDFDAAREEILLAIVSELAYAMKKQENITLKDSYISKRLNELKEFFLSDVEVNEAEIGLSEAKVKVQRLKTSPEARKKVREALGGHTSNLLEEVNLVFIEARNKLRKHLPAGGGTAYTDFVLIVDGMDRLYGYNHKSTQDDSQQALFIDDAPILTGLKAHCVFTIALSAMRAAESQLTQFYGRKPFLLPMVKTEQRGREHSPYREGYYSLTNLIEKRLPGGKKPEEIFEPKALEFLLNYSAGHIRNLLIFVRAATLEGERKLPITLRAVSKAVASNVTFNNPQNGTEDWDRLARLEISGTNEWHTIDTNHRWLLEQLFVGEYIDGGESDIFNDQQPWYAVHPVVRQLNPFKHAVDRVQKEQ